MTGDTRTKALNFFRTLIWTFAVASAAHAAFAQAPPTLPANPFGMGPMIQLDPATIKVRLQEEMEKCRRGEDIVDVHEKVGCKTLDAMLKVALGQHDAGFATFKESIVALEGVGDGFGAAVIHMLMAEAAKQTNRAAEAVAAYESAIAALEGLRKSNATVVLKSFAFFLRLAGLPEGLSEQMGPMMQMMQPMLIDQVEMMIRVSLAAYLMEQERFDEAEPHLQVARPLSRKLLGLMDGPVLDQLGRLREHQGRLDEARKIYEEAILAAQRSGDEARRLDLVGRLEAISRESPPEPPPPMKPELPSPPPPDGENQAAAPRAPWRLPSGRAGLLDLDPEILEARFRQEIDRCRASRDPPTVAECKLLEGLVKVESGSLAAGLVDLEASLEALEGLDDRVGSILVRSLMGDARSRVGHHAEALGLHKKALADVEALAASQEPLSMGILSTFLRFAGIPGIPTPLGPINPRSRAIIMALLELTVRDSMGSALGAQNRLEEAEEELRKAAALAESFFGLMDSQVYDHLGQVAALQGRFDEARNHYTRALDKTGLLGEMSLRLDILRRLTELERVSGRPVEAQRFSERALDLARRRGDRRNEALVWVDQAGIAFDRGLMADARKASEQALEAAAGCDDFLAKALAHVAGAMVAIGAGDYDDALGYFEKTLSILDGVDADLPQVTHMKVIMTTLTASTYEVLGMPEHIAEKAAQARKLALEAGNDLALAWSDFMREFGRRLEGRPDVLEQGVKSLLGTMNRSDKLFVRNLAEQSTFMTILPIVMGLDQRAVASAREWLEHRTDSGSPWEMAAATMVLAVDLGAKGRHSEAVEVLGKLVERSGEWQLLDVEALSTSVLAMIHWMNGHQKEAAKTSRRAVDLLERIAGSIHVDELLAGLFGKSRQRFFKVAVLLTALESQAEEAFEMAERARARALLHMLRNQRLDLRAGADQELLTELHDLRSEILALERNPSTSDELRQKRRAYEEVLVKIKLNHPEAKDLMRADPLDLATFQNEDLPPETSLVSYFMTPVSILAWVVDRESLTQVMVPIADDERQELVCLGERLAPGRDRAARSRAGCGGLDGLEEKYYSRLVAPLLPHVRHERMILVPHDVLHYVPFAALRDPDSGRYLLETKIISYTPSVSVLRFLAEKASPFDGEALVMGDPETELPELPGAMDEARTVAELFGTEPRFGADASESQVRASAGKIDLLHLAAHAVYRPQAPRFSHVGLAAGGGEDGLLEVDEVFSSLDLHGVNLVTLSACQTALGERTDGDEINGLTRAFIYAGSPAVVSTLWQVHDEATAFLMKEFYERLISGASYAEALRAAQRETQKQPGWGDPYYWAAFTLTGDPEGRWEAATPTADGQRPTPASRDGAPRRRALLVGINDYSASGLTAPRAALDTGAVPEGQREDWPDLYGAVNDVDAMREMLVGRFEFQDADVRVLKNQEATREDVLQALREHLVEPTRTGDVVVFHYSGHGSQVRNSKSEDRDKLDESIVPADSRLGAPDIRDKELRGLFNQVLAKGALPVVVLDSCHSGSGVRGLPDGALPRALAPDLRDVADGKDYGPPIEEHGALVLAATQDDEQAIERPEEGRYHGAFTSALLKALRAAPTGESSRYVFERTRGYLGAVGRYQRPVLEGLPARLAEPLFGTPSDSGPGDGVVAVERVWSDGRVDLLGGWIDGLAARSELVRLDAGDGAEVDAAPRLRVTGLDGLQRSHAEILEGSGSDPEVEAGQLFKIDSWVAEFEPLRVWIPRTESMDVALGLAHDLAASIGDGKLQKVEDPTETTPSHVLRWSGTVFELLPPGSRPQSLGPRPKAEDVLRLLGGEARLFVHLPAPDSLPEELEIGAGRRHSAIEIVDEPWQATYLLAGRPRGHALEYAWIRPGALVKDQGTVHLPARSAWIGLNFSEPERLATQIWKLQDKLLRLYKVFAWNVLRPDPDARAAFPYRLAVAEAGGTVVGDERLFSKRNYKLVLETKDRRPVDMKLVEDRYVYAFAIDGEGASSLLYPPPHISSENKYPGASAKNGLAPGWIDLGEDSLFDVVEPYGFDTFFLFTSDEPVPEPLSIFKYEGVRGREPPPDGALATLLAEVGATKRGTRSVSTTSRWSIEKRVYQTLPADN